MTTTTKQKIVDCHIHFIDSKANKHTFLEQQDRNFEEFVGDYSKLPRRYLLENYLQDTSNYQVQGVVWYEFLSTDPIKEARWAEALIQDYKIPIAMVTLVDFLDQKLEEKLEFYSSLSHVTAVREHMVWDNHNPKKRFANRPDLLTDPNWQKKLRLLNQYNFNCVLEVFAPQLSDLIKVIKNYPNIKFTIPALGWPLDLSDAGYKIWKQNLQLASECENVSLEIHAMECVFGMGWTLDQIKPWILSAIELFGTERCMFGSHMPIAKLSRSFTELYTSYENIVCEFTQSEKENLFYNVACNWFKL